MENQKIILKGFIHSLIIHGDSYTCYTPEASAIKHLQVFAVTKSLDAAGRGEPLFFTFAPYVTGAMVATMTT